MTIRKNSDGKEITLIIEGRIDSKTAPEFEDQVKGNIENADRMIIDLAGVNYISSAGLRVFLSAHKSMSAKEGLIIKNVCSEVMAIFEVTNFSAVLNIE